MVGGLELGNFPAPNVPANLSWLGEVTRDRSIERVQSERREYPGSPFFLLCVFAPLRESLPWPSQISNPHLKTSAAWCARFAQGACPNLPME